MGKGPQTVSPLTTKYSDPRSLILSSLGLLVQAREMGGNPDKFWNLCTVFFIIIFPWTFWRWHICMNFKFLFSHELVLSQKKKNAGKTASNLHFLPLPWKRWWTIHTLWYHYCQQVEADGVLRLSILSAIANFTRGAHMCESCPTFPSNDIYTTSPDSHSATLRWN